MDNDKIASLLDRLYADSDTGYISSCLHSVRSLLSDARNELKPASWYADPNSGLAYQSEIYNLALEMGAEDT